MLRGSRYLNAWDRLKGLGMSMRIAWRIVRFSVNVYFTETRFFFNASVSLTVDHWDEYKKNICLVKRGFGYVRP